MLLREPDLAVFVIESLVVGEEDARHFLLQQITKPRVDNAQVFLFVKDALKVYSEGFKKIENSKNS